MIYLIVQEPLCSRATNAKMGPIEHGRRKAERDTRAKCRLFEQEREDKVEQVPVASREAQRALPLLSPQTPDNEQKQALVVILTLSIPTRYKPRSREKNFVFPPTSYSQSVSVGLETSLPIYIPVVDYARGLSSERYAYGRDSERDIFGYSICMCYWKVT
jgi:hypothetical protein